MSDKLKIGALIYAGRLRKPRSIKPPSCCFPNNQIAPLHFSLLLLGTRPWRVILPGPLFLRCNNARQS